MEFKIVHSFFRTTFALPTTFNFALYMREATDSHILALVDVESSTWVILAGVCFLNLARIKIWQVCALFVCTYQYVTGPCPRTLQYSSIAAVCFVYLARVKGLAGAGVHSSVTPPPPVE